MASLDVDYLFTNVPLEETINICVFELFKSNSNIHGLSKNQITEMLFLTTKKLIILFDMAFSQLVHGVPGKSPEGLLYVVTSWTYRGPLEDQYKNFLKV